MQTYSEKELNQNTTFVDQINHKKKSELNPINYDEYTNWMTDNQKTFNNFMALSSAPQRNPYGITGNKNAMKELELQLPNRPTTQNNPFMNVDIESYNIPQKYGKANPMCGNQCKKNFYRTLIRNPNDALFDRQGSERQFYTTANSSVPSEQTKFAMWLYGNNQVGKSGSLYSRYGYPYTSDSLISTGNNAASPQNAGQVNNDFSVPHTVGASPWVNNPNYGYGFGGIQGAVPFSAPNSKLQTPSMILNPMNLFPMFPTPINHHPKTVPPGY